MQLPKLKISEFRFSQKIIHTFPFVKEELMCEMVTFKSSAEVTLPPAYSIFRQTLLDFSFDLC